MGQHHWTDFGQLSFCFSTNKWCWLFQWLLFVISTSILIYRFLILKKHRTLCSCFYLGGSYFICTVRCLFSFLACLISRIFWIYLVTSWRSSKSVVSTPIMSFVLCPHFKPLFSVHYKRENKNSLTSTIESTPEYCYLKSIFKFSYLLIFIFVYNLESLTNLLLRERLWGLT